MPEPTGAVMSAVSQWVPGLRKGSGNNWLGYCPIHGEVVGRSKPSFSIDEATGLWFCFAGCGGGGLPRLMKLLKKPKVLIDRTMERIQPHLQRTKKRDSIIETVGRFETAMPLPEKLLGLYEYLPESLTDPDTGFEEDLLFDHDIGFDPDYMRITYPVRDLKGRLAGIVGRATRENDRGKYVAYGYELEKLLKMPGYELHKSNYLWRWDRVYPRLYHSDSNEPVLVAEGFKACLWTVQAGYPNTLAAMGARLSDAQVAFLHRLGNPVILCLDNDHAGRVGTSKAIPKLHRIGVSVMRYPYPDIELSPDDLDVSELREAIERPYTPREWRKAYNIKPIRRRHYE